MGIQELLFLASVPVILLCLYVYSKDAVKEPKKLLTKLFVWGVISIIPILVLEIAVNTFVDADKVSNQIVKLIATFVGIGLIEEGAKWIITYKVVYNSKEFNHAYDAIVYAVFVSLGFALIENIFYVFGRGALTGVLRAFTTIPSHACDGIIMGYFLGLAKQEEYNSNQEESDKNMFMSLLIPIIAHTLYDYFIISGSDILLYVFIAFTVAMYIICFKLINKISKLNCNFDGKHFSEETIKPENNVSSTNSFKYAFSRTLLFSLLLLIIGGIILYI